MQDQPQNETVKIVIRPVEAGDKDFVFSTWLKGQYWGSVSYMGEQDQYFKDYGKTITEFICRPGTFIDCAVLSSAPNVVLGYIVYNDQHLFWSYVKFDFRKQGILNTLLKDMDFTEYSGSTKVGHAIGKKKELKFNQVKG